MRKYYPLISALAAIVLLLLPVVILLGSSKESEPPQSEDKAATASDDELEELKEQLTSVTSKLADLEAAETDSAKSREASTEKAPDSQGIQPDQFSPAGVGKQADAGQASDIRRIEDRIDELNKNLASLIAAQQSATEPAAEQPLATNEKPAPPDVAPSAELISPSKETETPSGSEAMTGESGTPPVPAEAEVLTSSELGKEAKKNLRDRMAADAEPAPGDEEPATELVEILLQRPVDGMTVNRVEQLYAQTTVPGWPVVLVRSSFDDEEWWAQPISGRRGTQIMARVHFGNEGTPRGSAFSMVILLLDGYEEAVRFRTARRFEKIPKGVRRSREFMFVLK